MTPSAPPTVDRLAAVRLFHALSDEIRLAVLERLRGGEQCVCELQEELGIAQSRLSFHLRTLKDAGLVRDRREGRWSYYRLDLDALRAAHDLVRALATDAPAPSRGLRVFGRCCTPAAAATITPAEQGAPA